MKHGSSYPKWHIKKRVFLLLLSLLAAIFACLFLLFNLYMKSYVEADAAKHLDAVQGRIADRNSSSETSAAKTAEQQANLSEMKNHNIHIQGNIVIISSDYSILDYNGSDSYSQLKKLVAQLKNENYSLNHLSHAKLSTTLGNYYISSEKDEVRTHAYMIFYENISQAESLIATINLVLLIFVGAAFVICFFFSRKIASTITDPVTDLSNFAGDIGQGNFSPHEFHFRDIEFMQLADAMNQSALQLKTYDSEQKSFFQNVSHELRTPLQSLRCYGEGLAYGMTDPIKSGNIILSETERLGSLVEDLLYISRQDMLSHADIPMHESDLRDTVSLSAAGLQAIADKKGIEIQFDFDDSPVLCLYNEDQIYRAVNNLISNALRYAEHKIRLLVYNSLGQAVVQVCDDGAGISDSDLPHIFERLYKGKNGKNGIGLSIVKTIIERHAGSISVNCSQETVFSIQLPKSVS